MSQDIVADGLNQLMNAVRAHKESVKLNNYSKVLAGVLAIGKLKGYIDEFKADKNSVKIVASKKLNACKAIKPRYVVKVGDIEKYIRRYLPAKDMGVLVISTSKGLMTHQTAIEQKIGGCLVAYFY